MRSRPIEQLELYPDYFEAPLVRVNIDQSQAHTDQSAHNMYLHTLAEGGVTLLFLLGLIILSTIRGLQRLARADAGVVSGLAKGVSYAIYGVLVAACFGNSYMNMIPMFFLLSLAGYLHSVARDVRPVHQVGDALTAATR